MKDLHGDKAGDESLNQTRILRELGLNTLCDVTCYQGTRAAPVGRPGAVHPTKLASDPRFKFLNQKDSHHVGVKIYSSEVLYGRPAVYVQHLAKASLLPAISVPLILHLQIRSIAISIWLRVVSQLCLDFILSAMCDSPT